jgi:hypothetical protein
MTTTPHAPGTASWSALERIQEYIAAAEPLVEDPEWDGTLPPDVDLSGAPDLTLAELPMAQALMERAARTRAGLERRMALILSELGGMGTRRDAARAYLANDTGS